MIMWEALSEYRVWCGWRTVIINELEAWYPSCLSIGGTFKLPGIVQKQQTTTSVHKTHPVSNLCCYNLYFSINWRTKLPCVCENSRKNRVQIMFWMQLWPQVLKDIKLCVICADMANPQNGHSCIQASQEADQDMKFASFFTLLLDYVKWLKQSQVTYNYCLSIGNTLKACASQNYTVTFIYLMHDTQACSLNKKPSVNVFYDTGCSVPCGTPEHWFKIKLRLSTLRYLTP